MTTCIQVGQVQHRVTAAMIHESSSTDSAVGRHETPESDNKQ